MKRWFVLAVVLMAISAPAFAVNVLVNGSFDNGELGWNRWRAPWGSTETYTVAGGVGSLSGAGGNGSFGWYQTVAVPVGVAATVDAIWSGNIGGGGWAEVMVWTQATPGGEGNRADTGNAADIAFKKDSWGLNPPTSWNWQAASLSPHPSGNGGTVISQGYVVVALKNGGFPMGTLNFDSVTLDVVPEPGSMVALLSGLVGLGGLVIRRKR